MAAVGAAGIALVLVAAMTTTARVGVDYEVHERSLPLYQKVIAFLHRDIEMRALAGSIVAGMTDPEARALRLLEWTARNIRPVPPGLPVIDDHPYSIVVRGYGTDDQAATVLASLAAYSGLAALRAFAPNGTGGHHAFVAITIDGDWRIFDARGVAFRAPDGRLASASALRADPRLAEAAGADNGPAGPAYPELVARIDLSQAKSVTDHMPLERLGREIRRLLRLSD
ncbi:MAG: transglutaminase domain-containing protein [Chloroflexi bacterium]|nr:transglutaminase domain-containing protein [Chloroflexota bacterium]